MTAPDEKLTDNPRAVLYLSRDDWRTLRALRAYYERTLDRTLTTADTIREALRELAFAKGLTDTVTQPGALTD